MFREQYKGEFDEIKGNRAQIDEIFALAESQPKKKAKIIPFRHATTVAAAVVIVLALYVYPDVNEFFKPENRELEPVGVVVPEIQPITGNTAISAAKQETNSKSELLDRADTKQYIGEVVTEKADITSAAATGAAETAPAEDTTESEPAKSEGTQETEAAENGIAVAMFMADEPEADDTVTEYSYTKERTAEPPAAVSGGQSETPKTDTDESAAATVTGSFGAASGGGSSAAAQATMLLYAESADLGEGKTVNIYVYSKNNLIQSKLDTDKKTISRNGGRLLIVNTDVAYAEKDGVYYQFVGANLTDEELNHLIDTKLQQ